MRPLPWVASNGSGDHSISPDVEVNTLEERRCDQSHSRAFPIVTVEHGIAFAIHHDSMNPDGSYSAVIWMLKGPIKELRSKPVRPSGPELKERRSPRGPVLAA
jgi:hypothetical protein